MTLLLFCNVGNPCVLFEKHASLMGEDFAYQIKSAITNYAITSVEAHVKSYVFTEIDRLLKYSGYNLTHFNLPEPTVHNTSIITNRC